MARNPGDKNATKVRRREERIDNLSSAIHKLLQTSRTSSSLGIGKVLKTWDKILDQSCALINNYTLLDRMRSVIELRQLHTFVDLVRLECMPEVLEDEELKHGLQTWKNFINVIFFSPQYIPSFLLYSFLFLSSQVTEKNRYNLKQLQVGGAAQDSSNIGEGGWRHRGKVRKVGM